MASYHIPMFSCKLCPNFRASAKWDWERHVAIIHAEGNYSTLLCQLCQKRFFDFEHFVEHTKAVPTCNLGCYMVRLEPLSDHIKHVFTSLVEQMMVPLPEAFPMQAQNRTVQTMRFLSSPTKSSKSDLDASLLKALVKEEKLDDLGKDDSFTQDNVSITAEPNGFVQNGEEKGRRAVYPKWTNVRIKSEELIMNQEKAKVKWNSQKNGEMNGRAMRTIYPQSDVHQQCQQIFGERKTATCSLCNKNLRTPSSIYAFDHVMSHRHLEAYYCRFCDFKTTTSSKIRTHLTSKHHTRGTIANYVDNTDQYKNEIVQLFENCFGQVNGENANSEKVASNDESVKEENLSYEFEESLDTTDVNCSDKCSRKQEKSQRRGSMVGRGWTNRKNLCSSKRSAVTTTTKSDIRRVHCQNLLRRNAKSGLIQCRWCSKHIRTTYTSGRREGRILHVLAMQHAEVHLGQPLYHCYHCDIDMKNTRQLNAHFRRRHCSIRTATDTDYSDNTEKYHEEIIDALNKCFGGKKNSVVEDDQVGKKKVERLGVQNVQIGKKKDKRFTAVMPRSLVKTQSKLLQRRQAFSRYLINRFSNSGKLECLKCAELINVNPTKGAGAVDTFQSIQHAQHHLGEPLYQCRYCSFTASNLTDMRSHVLDGHPSKQVTIRINCIDRTHLYHEQIQTALADCFQAEKRRRRNRGSVVGKKVIDSVKEKVEEGASSSNVVSTPGSHLFQCQHPGCQFVTKRIILYEKHLKFMHKD